MSRRGRSSKVVESDDYDYDDYNDDEYYPPSKQQKPMKEFAPQDAEMFKQMIDQMTIKNSDSADSRGSRRSTSSKGSHRSTSSRGSYYSRSPSRSSTPPREDTARFNPPRQETARFDPPAPSRQGNTFLSKSIINIILDNFTAVQLNQMCAAAGKPFSSNQKKNVLAFAVELVHTKMELIDFILGAYTDLN